LSHFESYGVRNFGPIVRVLITAERMLFISRLRKYTHTQRGVKNLDLI
jgi:hypothetical protein